MSKSVESRHSSSWSVRQQPSESFQVNPSHLFIFSVVPTVKVFGLWSHVPPPPLLQLQPHHHFQPKTRNHNSIRKPANQLHRTFVVSFFSVHFDSRKLLSQLMSERDSMRDFWPQTNISKEMNSLPTGQQVNEKMMRKFSKRNVEEENHESIKNTSLHFDSLHICLCFWWCFLYCVIHYEWVCVHLFLLQSFQFTSLLLLKK